MSGDAAAQALIYALLLLLPLSALAARRLPLSTMVKYALAWTAIFAAALLLVTVYRQLARGDDAPVEQAQTNSILHHGFT